MGKRKPFYTDFIVSWCPNYIFRRLIKVVKDQIRRNRVEDRRRRWEDEKTSEQQRRIMNLPSLGPGSSMVGQGSSMTGATLSRADSQRSYVMGSRRQSVSSVGSTLPGGLVSYRYSVVQTSDLRHNWNLIRDSVNNTV